MRLANITAGVKALYSAQKKIADTIARELPVGAALEWERGGHVTYGTVFCHGKETRIKVRNSFTGKVYWIDVRSIPAVHDALYTKRGTALFVTIKAST